MKTNEPKHATAIEYGENPTPVVTAKGCGAVAEEILQLAQSHGVFIHEDKNLSDFLQTIDIGSEIPRELYLAIAEVIAHIYMLEGKVPKNWQP